MKSLKQTKRIEKYNFLSAIHRTSFSGYSLVELLSSGLVIAALLLHLLSLIFQPYLNHDVAEYISIGQMIVNGATPYTGIIDVNPPMIFYLSSLPVLISNISKISIPIVSLFFFFGIMLLCGYIFIQVLGIEAGRPLTRVEKNLLWTFWIFLSFFTYETDNFAQREQLIFMFLAGFIVLRKARYDGRKILLVYAVICGLFAAIAFSMKPQFILAIIMIELLFLVFSRMQWNVYLAPEIIVIVLFGIFYLGHFFLIPGETNYFTYWIPLISKGYSAYNASWQAMFAALFADRLAFINLLFIGIGAILLVRKQYTRQMGLFFAFTAYGFASLIIYFLQFKGWLYQTLGFHYGALTGFIFLVRENAKFSLKFKNTLLAILIIMNLSGGFLTAFDKGMQIKEPFQFPEKGIASLIKQFVSKDDKVLFLSTVVGATFPQMTYTERMSAGRFLTAFPIAFFTNRSPEGTILPGWERDEQLFFTWLLQDISGQKPVLVFVDLSEDGQTYAYLSKRHFFNFISKDYQCIGETEQLIVYWRSSGNEAISMPARDKISTLYQQQILQKTSYCS